MKKFIKSAAIFAAIAMLSSAFISCSTDDDEETTKVTSKPGTEQGTGTGSGTGGSGTGTGGGTGTGTGSGESLLDANGNVKNYDDSSLAAATLWVVGDSTVCDYMKEDGTHTDATYFYPRYGYGTQLGNNLSSKITVKNIALSGRSSKSFLTEACYATMTSEMKAGDFLVIGFGHNDEKSDDADRFAPANQSTDTAGSFKNILYTKYVKLAQDKGATPILCSPICRASDKDDYSSDKAHITANGDYGKAVEELAAEKSVQFVDLRGMTKDLYSEIKYAEAIKMHAIPQGASDTEPKWASVDATHINIFGAKMVSYFFAKTIYESTSALKPYVKSMYKPTEAVDLVKNDKFVYVAYTAVDWSKYVPESYFSTISENWYGTAFGNLGGATKINLFKATETAAGKFEVGQTEASGKIAASQDGIAFAFQQLPISKNFTLTAKAKVLNAVKDKTQAGFGLMLRDDCYVPVNDTALASNYVAAGFLANAATTPSVNWKREATKLGLDKTVTGYWAVNDTAELSIERVGQVVKVKTIYKGTTYEDTYTDFDFVAKDSDYFYAGMFGTRGTLVEFTDVVLTITGDSQGA